MVCLSFISALILSVLASALAEPQAIAKELDRSKQMMIAARILSHEGYFIIKDKEGKTIPAKYGENGILVPGTKEDIPTRSELVEVYKKRFVPRLVNRKGEETTFEKANIDFGEYVNDYKKSGYYKQPWMLIYEILPNTEETEKQEIEGYIIPVNGFGLWDAIYGYLAIAPDGDTVIGISWYEHKETPGLGANISDAPWQSLFPEKKIFQESSDGTTNFETAPIGVTVVKGKVAEVLGDVPKAKSAVDGMAGATLTGNGVTDAYKEVLAPYRTFLIRLQKEKKE